MAAIQQMLFATGSSVFLPNSLSSSASATTFGNPEFPSLAFASSGITLRLRTNSLLTLTTSAQGTVAEPASPVVNQSTWLVGGSASVYSVRMRLLTAVGDGFAVGSDSVNTWLPITQERIWEVRSSAAGAGVLQDTDGVTAVMEIALTASTSTILAFSNINLSTTALVQLANPQ